MNTSVLTVIAESISGWMEPIELHWLAEKAQAHLRIIEIGSWMGRSTRALADNTDGVVIAVDTWNGSEEHRNLLIDKEEGYLLAEFKRNLSPHLESGKVRYCQRTSLEAAAEFLKSGETFDMIFIDASHNFEDVASDIEAWSKVLTQDGLICGHDFGNRDAITGRCYEGLEAAVRAKVPDFEVIVGGSIWYKDNKMPAVQIETPIPRATIDRKVRKTVWTLNINYPRAITDLTYPLMRAYAKKIGADFEVIDRNPWTGPVAYAKFMVHELGKKNDWNIFFDSDALVHPALFDVTECIQKDTVMFCERDLVGNRFMTDDYFRRDGRQISACSWFVVSSNWCHDLWEPLSILEMPMHEAVSRIIPQPVELDAGITPSHLLDDYVMSRNIAKYGLKYKQFKDVLKELNCEGQNYFWHTHLVSESVKAVQMRVKLDDWRIVRLKPLEREQLLGQLAQRRDTLEELITT